MHQVIFAVVFTQLLVRKKKNWRQGWENVAWLWWYILDHVGNPFYLPGRFQMGSMLHLSCHKGD